MNEKKFSVLAAELKDLTSDFYFVETNEVKNFTAKLIVEKATELIAAANEDEAKPPVKSEMPCNCRQEKSLQSVISSVAKRIEENSDNGKGLAAIMIVSLENLLVAGD